MNNKPELLWKLLKDVSLEELQELVPLPRRKKKSSIRPIPGARHSVKEHVNHYKNIIL